MCQLTSPVNNCGSSSYRGEHQNTQGTTIEHKSSRLAMKMNLTKSVSIDSGLNKLQDDLSIGLPIKNVLHDHNDSYDTAQFQGSTINILQEQQSSTHNACTPKKTDVGYQHAEDMPVHYGDQEVDQMPDHLVPIHAFHNESLTPMKLASSTINSYPREEESH